jgi:5-methylcytosine-specific restriction endonuclease McrA
MTKTTKQEMKRCSGECGEIKPLAEFNKQSSNGDGLMYQCKTCQSKYNRVYKTSPKGRAVEALSQANKAHRKAEVLLGRLIKNTLTWEQLLFVLSNGECVYCRKELDYTEATVDHVLTMKSGKGDNTYENIVCACGGCNKSKNDRPVLEYLRKLDNPLQLRRVIDRLSQRKGISYYDMYEQLRAEVEPIESQVTASG